MERNLIRRKARRTVNVNMKKQTKIELLKSARNKRHRSKTRVDGGPETTSEFASCECIKLVSAQNERKNTGKKPERR